MPERLKICNFPNFDKKNPQNLIICLMHQSFVTMPPPQAGWRIAMEVGCYYFWIALQCRGNTRDLCYIGKNGSAMKTCENGLAVPIVWVFKQGFAG